MSRIRRLGTTTLLCLAMLGWIGCGPDRKNDPGSSFAKADSLAKDSPEPNGADVPGGTTVTPAPVSPAAPVAGGPPPVGPAVGPGPVGPGPGPIVPPMPIPPLMGGIPFGGGDRDRGGDHGGRCLEECEVTSDCINNNPCVTVSCIDGNCIETPIPGCTYCNTDLDCPRGEICEDHRCVANTFTVSGTISGYTGAYSGLVLELNGANPLPITGGAVAFTFPESLANGSSYAVTVSTQPTGSPPISCSVTNGSGTIDNANVTNVVVTCTPVALFTIGGSISGYSDSYSGLVLELNGLDPMTITGGATSYVFSPGLASGATYAVTVSTQPTGSPAINCTVSNSPGTMPNHNVTNVNVSCVPSVTPALLTVAGVTSPIPITASANSWALSTSPTSLAPDLLSVSCTSSIFNISTSLSLCIAGGTDKISGLPLLYRSIDAGVSWMVPTISLADPGSINGTSCTDDNTVCMAVGQDNKTGLPTIFVSTDLGITWITPTITLPTAGVFKGVSCTGSGVTAECVVVGQNTTTDGPPLLYVSQDGGTTWTQPGITTIDPGSLNSASCAGTVCIAGGTDTFTGLPLLYQSVDGGTTWTAPVTFPDDGVILSTSCTDNGGPIVCAVAGNDNATHLPLLYVNTDVAGAGTWNAVALSPAPLTGSFSATSCTSSGGTARCVAAGQDTHNNIPLLYSNTDVAGVGTWNIITTSSAPGMYNSASCSAGICAVAGQTFSTNLPLLYISDDGVTWTPEPAPQVGVYNNVSCETGTTSTGIGSNCAAVGEFMTATLYSSNDGANTWNPITTTPLPDLSAYYSTSCTGTGVNTFCTVSGVDYTLPNPLLFYSVGGASPWTNSNLTGTYLGAFVSTSCAGSPGNAICTAVGNNNVIPGGFPLLYITTDNGTSWNVFPLNETQGTFTSTSCTGTTTDTDVVCTAAGQTATGSPMLYVSTDGATTWTSISSLTTDQGILNSTSCTGEGATAICTAVGQDTTTSAPLLYSSIDGGMTWVARSTSADNGVFNATNCVTTSSGILCTAVGQDTTSGFPALYTSTDGVAWTLAPIIYTDHGVFNATSCAVNGSATVCTAAGQNADLTALLYFSTDGGMTWTSAPPLVSLPTAIYKATSCTASGFGVACTASGQDLSTGVSLLNVNTDVGVSTWNQVATAPGYGSFLGSSPQ